MEYEEEGVSPVRIPEFGAIFMSSNARRRESSERKLLGLPTAQESFVKRVKSGMILFIFEFEKRELYGVYQACSDGAMDIVPHAFSSYGKQFRAQVRYTVIWHCSPLSECEFQDAISENYYTPKKFTFGLSKDQVHKLLQLFSSRKAENTVPRRQLSERRHFGEKRHLGERILVNEKINLRNKAEKFVEEDDIAHSISIKYNGNSPSDSQRPDSKRVFENTFEYDGLTEHEGVSLGGRKAVSDNVINFMEDKLGFDYDVHTRHYGPINNANLGDLNSAWRQNRENQFVTRDTSQICDNLREYLPRVRGDLNGGRVETRDLIGYKHRGNDDLLLRKTDERFEIPRTELIRPIDEQRLFMDRDILYDRNPVGNPKSFIYADQISNSADKLRIIRDDDQRLLMDQKLHHDDHNSICDPNLIIHADQYSKTLAKVRRKSDGDQIHLSDRTQIRRSVDKDIDPIVSDRLRLSPGYANLYQHRSHQSSFSPNKPSLEAHYSLSQNQQKVFPPSSCSMGQSIYERSYPTSFAMEKNTLGVSYVTSRASVPTRSVPYGPDFIEVNDTSHSAQDYVRCHSRVGDDFFTSIKPSYHTDYEDPRSVHGVNEVPARDSQELYDDYEGRIGNYLSGRYGEKIEQPSIADEIYEDQLLYSRTPTYSRRNISPSINFNDPTLVSQDRENHGFLANATDPAITDHQDRTVKYRLRRLPSGSSFETFNDYDARSYQDPDGVPTDSKKRKTSIFSRLSTSSRKLVEYDVVDESVDEVMENLFESLGQNITDTRKNTPLDKRHISEDIIKRREKKFGQVEVKEPTKVTRKKVMECRLATKEGEIVEDVSRETRGVDFKRRSDIKKTLTGGKKTYFTGPDLDHEKEDSGRKPEGEREEGQGECKQLKRRKLVRPAFGKKEDLNGGYKDDACSNSQFNSENASCNKFNCDSSRISLENFSPHSGVHKKLVKQIIDNKEESNENTKQDGVSDLFTLKSSSCNKVNCDSSGISLETPSPHSGAHKKLVRQIFKNKEESNENTKQAGVSDLLTHKSSSCSKVNCDSSGISLEKPSPHSGAHRKLVRQIIDKKEESDENTKQGGVSNLLTHKRSSCIKVNSDLSSPSLNSRVQRKLVRRGFDKKEQLNDNTKIDPVLDLSNHENLNDQKLALSKFSARVLGNPNLQLSCENSSSCSKGSCDFMDTSLGNPSPNSRVSRKLVRPVFDKKGELNDDTNRDGGSNLLTYESLNNEKISTPELPCKTLEISKFPSPNSGSLGPSP